jgi:2-oxo-4-hydroxy-4-carboxy-5-ureidoimidazoline decarboxylase
VARFGGVFEGAPWIAREAWEERPFGSVDGLHAAMVWVVEHSPRAARIELIRAHPDLAGRAAIAGELGSESTREQAAAGLDRLTPEQRERLTWLTAAYGDRFGFPFVICAREHTPDSIIAAAARRLENDPEEEERNALAEIAKIARLRIEDLVDE